MFVCVCVPEREDQRQHLGGRMYSSERKSEGEKCERVVMCEKEKTSSSILAADVLERR